MQQIFFFSENEPVAKTDVVWMRVDNERSSRARLTLGGLPFLNLTRIWSN